MKVVHLDHAASFNPLLSMVKCFPFPDGNHILARFNTYFHVVSQSPRKIQNLSLDPTIMSILVTCFRPPTAIVPMKPSNAFVLVLSKKMLKTDGDNMRLWRTVTVV